MRTQYVATIPLDEERLAEDIKQSASFSFSEAYSDYLVGGPWKSCMLWASGGDIGDGYIDHYASEQPAAFTEYGKQLPYLQKLITDVADLGRLNFVRLARFSNSVIVPHRDYVEFGDLAADKRASHRVHIPLITNEYSLFSEGNVVYRMRPGEIWYLDVTQIHSVASMRTIPRYHLIFDFFGKAGAGPLVQVEDQGNGAGPSERAVDRPPLSDAERDSLLRLAETLTMDTFSEVFSIVAKKHFRSDGGDDFVWATMTEIARNSKDPEVLKHTLEMHRHTNLERSA
jgi:hypothetical protein